MTHCVARLNIKIQNYNNSSSLDLDEDGLLK